MFEWNTLYTHIIIYIRVAPDNCVEYGIILYYIIGTRNVVKRIQSLFSNNIHINGRRCLQCALIYIGTYIIKCIPKEDVILLLLFFYTSEWTGGVRGAYGCTSARSTALARDPNAINEKRRRRNMAAGVCLHKSWLTIIIIIIIIIIIAIGIRRENRRRYLVVSTRNSIYGQTQYYNIIK